MDSQCFKCKSEKIIPQVRVMDRGHYSGDAGDLSVVSYEDPDALVFKGAKRSSLYARICGECGYAELYVENPRELYARYEGSAPGGSLLNL
ncbi:MAG: hypothetical protein JST93_33025 [Acidobacteria bacterium]|nr:hypothetical protein [Acidobacteriota bacterium]